MKVGPSKSSWLNGVVSIALGLLAVWPAVVRAEGNRSDGKTQYMSLCATCHGKNADGNGPGAKGLKTKATAFNDKAKLAPEAKFFEVTHLGGKAVGLSAEMPPFPKLTAVQVHYIILYIQTLAT